MSCNGKLFCYESTKDLALDIAIKILSWLLICGLATSVNLKTFTSRLREKAILVGVACQFFMFPFVGFLCIIAYQLSPVNSLVLLILVSSPGGSYSNLWCSLWNADLALSVAMTSVSTCCSLFMLPWNLFLYVNTLYPLVQGGTCGDDVNSTGCEPAETEWSIIGFTLAIVISAVLTGLLIGEKFPSQRDRANMIGNICGLLSIVLSVFVSGSSDTPPWEQPINVIMACGTPLIVGVAMATLIARVLKLEKPKAVAIGVETGYQSVTIALIYAFQLGEEGKAAIGLTVIYGAWEIVVFGVFCFTLWKLGWTYSPSTKLVDLPRMLFFNFQDKEKQEARSGSLATGI